MGACNSLLQHAAPSRQYRTLLNGGVALSALLAIAAALLTLAHLHHEAESRAILTTRNLAKAIAQTVSSQLDSIDLAVRASSREIGRQMAGGRVDQDSISAMLTEQGERIPGVANFQATDEKGDVRYGPEIASAINISDRENFGRLRVDADAGLVADQPMFGRISEQWVWSFARRINRPDGSFGGVVLATLSIDQIEKMFAQIKMAANSLIALRDAELRLVARYAGPHADPHADPLPLGEKRLSESFRLALAANTEEGSYSSGAHALDGIDRLFSYHCDAKYGFMVNVGIERNSAFADWRRQSWTVAGLVSTFILAMLIFAQLIRRAWRWQEDAAASFAEAQKIARIGHYRYDMKSGCWVSSEIFDQIFGIGPDYVRDTRHWVELAAPDCRATRQAELDDVIKGGGASESEYRIVRPSDGCERWVHSKAKLQFSADGSPLLVVGTVQDLTERKHAESALRVAATAFDSQEAMIITDRNTVILRVNRAFTESTGYRAEDVVGRTTRMFKSDRHDAAFFAAIWESIRHSGGWQGEIWDRRKDGKEYQKWLTISAVKDEEGAVTHYVGAQYDITARKQTEQKINELAFFDRLTGLPNRTLLLDRLKQAMTASGRTGSYCALLFVDLDNFKTLNDTLSHELGDLLLRQVAQRLALCVREDDTVARLGGDDFVVVLSGLSAREANAAHGTELVARKILGALNHVYQLAGVDYHSTASIGATLFRGALISVDDLMKQSDLTLYKAKAAGRNTFLFFDPVMEVAVKERAALEDDLRRALSEKQFILHYQAQVVDDGHLLGAEVLVRWQHPQRGLIMPGAFIPLAEETGLILPLGHWVLETACRQLVRWAERSEMALLTIAVNVSVVQFRQPDFVDQVLEVIRATGANPERLKFELTESLLVDKVEQIIEKMTALKARGIAFSLDDFGTGYSSLSYLKRLPLDQLKIDQSFVRDVLVDASGASIAKTVVALAHSLGLGVMAEGVETEAQRDFLASAGCHAYQGYFFSRPVPVSGFELIAVPDAARLPADF